MDIRMVEPYVDDFLGRQTAEMIRNADSEKA